MSFVSLDFFGFLAVCFTAYFAVPKKWRWLVLLGASLIFYWLASGALIVCLLLTASTTYGAALWVEKILKDGAAASKDLDRQQKKERKAATTRKCRWVLFFTMALNFGFLVFLKYNGTLYSALSALGGLWGFTVWDFTKSILFPLGVSFYTFQSMGYLFDVYRKKVSAEKNPLKLLLFVSFFPQIVQGPIGRWGELASQLFEGHGFDYRQAKFGAQLIAWGAFKKLVIADRATVLVNTVFGGYPEPYHGPVLWVAVLFYTVQIYTDFSGGIDIARGAAQMVGIHMAENFRRPYFAPTIAEFWRRWHITLGGWCRDYIFYPLSLSKPLNKLSKKSRELLGNRVGKLVPVLFSQFVVFIVIGMWHGSQFKYIAFGLYHGFFIIGGILLEEPLARLSEKLHLNRDAWWFRVFQVLRTFFIVTYGRFFSRAGSFTQALSMMGSCFVPAAMPNLLSLGLGGREMLVLALATGVLFLVSLLQEQGVALREWVENRPGPVRWLIYFAGVLSILLLGAYGTQYDATAFIYMGF